MKQKKTSSILRWLWIPFLFLFFLALTPLTIRGIGAILIIADPLKPADAAVALTGDQGDRIGAAVELYKNGYIDALYITFTDEQTRSALVNTATNAGFPLQLIFVTEMQVSDTLDEAKAIENLAANRGNKSLIVITDPYHTLRTRLIFQRELKGTGIDLQVRGVAGHWYRSNTWWKTSEGIRYTLEEYLKIFLFLLRIKN